MKIIQLSDLHLVCPGKKLGLIDPQKRLESAINHINQYHDDAQCCIITGDITDTANARSYALARDMLEKLVMPYHIMIGNHDLRRPLLDAFPNTPSHSGFIQYKLKFENHIIICLDTVKEHVDYGEFCDRRAQWLADTLAGLETALEVFLFMHHPPFNIHIPWTDEIKLIDDQLFYAAIKPFPIKFLFFGHVHRPSLGSWRNIPYASCRSIGNYQIATYSKPGIHLPMNAEAPMYSVITILKEQVHVDMQDFLNDEIVFQG